MVITDPLTTADSACIKMSPFLTVFVIVALEEYKFCLRSCHLAHLPTNELIQGGNGYCLLTGEEQNSTQK